MKNSLIQQLKTFNQRNLFVGNKNLQVASFFFPHLFTCFSAAVVTVARGAEQVAEPLFKGDIWLEYIFGYLLPFVENDCYSIRLFYVFGKSVSYGLIITFFHFRLESAK